MKANLEVNFESIPLWINQEDIKKLLPASEIKDLRAIGKLQFTIVDAKMIYNINSVFRILNINPIIYGIAKNEEIAEVPVIVQAPTPVSTLVTPQVFTMQYCILVTKEWTKADAILVKNEECPVFYNQAQRNKTNLLKGKLIDVQLYDCTGKTATGSVVHKMQVTLEDVVNGKRVYYILQFRYTLFTQSFLANMICNLHESSNLDKDITIEVSRNENGHSKYVVSDDEMEETWEQPMESIPLIPHTTILEKTILLRDVLKDLGTLREVKRPEEDRHYNKMILPAPVKSRYNEDF